MSNHKLMKGLLVAAVAFVGAWAFAQAPAQEQALTRSAQDAQLQWGPCPPFMPAGCGLAVLHGDPAKANADVFLKLPAECCDSRALAHVGRADGARGGRALRHLQRSAKGRAEARDVRLRTREASA